MKKSTELNQTNNDWGDARLLALRNQMADAGLVVQTVAEGVNFLLKLLEAQREPDGWQPSRFAADASAN